MNSQAWLLAAVGCFFFTGVAFGYVWGLLGERRQWQDEMIRRRHAVYHWENGRWYWNEDEPKTSRDPAADKVRAMR